MRASVGLALVVVLVCLASSATAEEPPALAKARALYNAADYEGAIGAATLARQQPPFADAAALVVARAHLEQYRLRADPADLSAARDALGTVRAAALTARDQVDLIIGLGQALFLDELFGPAAELLDTALSRAALLGPRDRRLLLDWWASALDREAQTRSPERRPRLFERIRARMESELHDDPGSAVANYWLAVAARGEGDIDHAWDAAVAGWVRSSLAPDTMVELRGDLDRLVMQALIPERVRTRAPGEQQDASEALRLEWEAVKGLWAGEDVTLQP
jgi:hypothetical protein